MNKISCMNMIKLFSLLRIFLNLFLQKLTLISMCRGTRLFVVTFELPRMWSFELKINKKMHNIIPLLQCCHIKHGIKCVLSILFFYYVLLCLLCLYNFNTPCEETWSFLNGFVQILIRRKDSRIQCVWHKDNI